MTQRYKKEIRYLFKAGGEEWAIEILSSNSIYIEETQKNGQEDCHMGAEITYEDGKWVFEDDLECSSDPERKNYTREHIEFYASKDTPDKILEYLNTYPPPVDDVK